MPTGRLITRFAFIVLCTVAGTSCIVKHTGASSKWADSYKRVQAGTLNDFAEVLDYSTRNRITAMLHDFNARSKSNGIQVTVVTETAPQSLLNVDNVNRFAIAVRAEIEDTTPTNAVVLVLVVAPAMVNRSAYGISNGEAVAKLMSPADRSRIYRQMSAYLAGNDEDAAVLNGTLLLIAHLATQEHINPEEIEDFNLWRSAWKYWAILIVGLGTAFLISRFSRTPFGKRLTRTLYWWTCIGLWIYFLRALFVAPGGPAKNLNGLPSAIWSRIFTSDSSLNVLIGIIAIVTVIGVLPGFIVVGIWIICLSLGLGAAVAILRSIFGISPAGALILVIIAGAGIAILLKKRGVKLGGYFQKAVDALFGIFFDWWLTRIVRRRKEKRVMDEVRRKRERYEEATDKLRSDFPEVADFAAAVPVSRSSDDTWIERVIERFHDRDRQKTQEEKIKLAAQARRLYAEYRGAMDEYRGVLEAHDNIGRVKGTFKEKDEETTLRELERKKRRLILEKEIKDLEKEPPEPPPVDKRTPEQRKLEKLDRCREDLAQAKARCNGDPKCIEEAELIFEDRRINIMMENG
jgi:uncharacterized membrane protein YgcG